MPTIKRHDFRCGDRAQQQAIMCEPARAIRNRIQQDLVPDGNKLKSTRGAELASVVLWGYDCLEQPCNHPVVGLAAFILALD